MFQAKEVYTLDNELSRLDVQNHLLRDYEQPIYERIFAGRTDLSVLDIGCNDGRKTADRFHCAPVSRVIGVEYHGRLVSEANASFGGDIMQFFQLDVENPSFPAQLSAILQQKGMAAFDVINISFLLMHLRQPQQLLAQLRPFLKPDGVFVIIEADDRYSSMQPDENHYMETFLKICREDQYSGNRNTGGAVPDMLAACGYRNITVHMDCIDTTGMDSLHRAMLFSTFFSFIPLDYECLCQQEPDNAAYCETYRWLKEHYDAFQEEFVHKAQHASCGVCIVTCSQ